MSDTALRSMKDRNEIETRLPHTTDRYDHRKEQF